jgi:dTDP-4-amino-4,6-dideoxygalactose transaminase
VIHGFTEYREYAPMGSLPNSETAAARHCALPLSATTTDAEVEQVVEAVKTVASVGVRP